MILLRLQLRALQPRCIINNMILTVGLHSTQSTNNIDNCTKPSAAHTRTLWRGPPFMAVRVFQPAIAVCHIEKRNTLGVSSTSYCLYMIQNSSIINDVCTMFSCACGVANSHDRPCLIRQHDCPTIAIGIVPNAVRVFSLQLDRGAYRWCRSIWRSGRDAMFRWRAFGI